MPADRPVSPSPAAPETPQTIRADQLRRGDALRYEGDGGFQRVKQVFGTKVGRIGVITNEGEHFFDPRESVVVRRVAPSPDRAERGPEDAENIDGLIVVCEDLKRRLVPFGATAEGWDSAIATLRRLRAAPTGEPSPDLAGLQREADSYLSTSTDLRATNLVLSLLGALAGLQERAQRAEARAAEAERRADSFRNVVHAASDFIFEHDNPEGQFAEVEERVDAARNRLRDALNARPKRKPRRKKP